MKKTSKKSQNRVKNKDKKMFKVQLCQKQQKLYKKM